MASTGKIAEVMFENAFDTYEHQTQLLDLVTMSQPEAAMMQNSNNVYWRPVQQHAPIIDGFDLSGKETDIIEETVPLVLGDPANDFVRQRADDLRDEGFWARRGIQSGKRQSTEANKRLAETMALQGSLFFNSAATSGYDFIAEGQTIMNERQGARDMGACFVLNDRANLKFSKDLAGRQTLQGRPEETWRTGQIGQNVAEFDQVMTGSYLPNLVGGADPATTTTADVSEVPEGGSVTSTNIVTNVDYRLGTLPVVASASYNVGDKISIDNTVLGVVQSVGLADKTLTDQDMTFTVVGIPDGTTLEIFPKPIALDDPALTTLQAAYSNINNQILSGATINRLNTAASSKVNLFWAKDAVEIIGGTIPAELFTQFDGMKVINDTLSNGLEMYMIYDGEIDTLTFRFRIFTWYGINVINPSMCGVGLVT